MSLLAAVVTGLYGGSLLLWAFIWKGHLPFYIDARLYALPDRVVNLEAARQGLIPLWNPLIGCGTPHLANWQSAFFYPPFWIFNRLGLGDWFMGSSVAHLALAFGGGYLWLRGQRAAPLFSALGAMAFAGSAALLRSSTNLPFLATAAWIPWIFWSFNRAIRNPTLFGWAAGGAFLCLQALAGYPFFMFYTVLLLVVWFEFQRPSGRSRGAFWTTLCFSAVLTAAQWLPFLDFLNYSWHDTWKDYPYFTKSVEYLTLLQPDILGLPGSLSYRGSFANSNFNLYFGILPLAAFLSGFFSRETRKFWGVAAVLWLVWLAGRRFILLDVLPARWLEWVEPSKAAVLFVFCASTFAALALDSFFTGRGSGKKSVLLAAVLGLAWTGDLLRVPFRLLDPMPNPYWNQEVQKDAARVRALTGGGRMLSLHSPGEFLFSGADARSRSYEAPVRLFLPNSNEVWGIRSADEYLFLRVDGMEDLTRYMNRGYPFPGDLWDIAGVRLLLISQTLPGGKYRTLGRFHDDYLVSNPGASPDLRWVGRMSELPTRPDILYRLTKPDSGWRDRVYLEGKGSEIGLAAARRSLETLPSARIQKESPGRTLYGFNADRPGYVVFNEAYCPGWRAWLDGVPRPILRAYGLFMAVATPGGKGRQGVEFRYEPAAFRLGLFLSLLGMSSALFGLAQGYKQKPKTTGTVIAADQG